MKWILSRKKKSPSDITIILRVSDEEGEIKMVFRKALRKISHILGEKISYEIIDLRD